MRRGDVSRIDDRRDQNVPRLHLGRLNAIDLDDVVTERRFDYGTHVSRTKCEHHLLELGNKTAAAELKSRIQGHLLSLGKVDEARKTLQALSTDIGAPSGMRQRASALLTGLGPQDK